MNFVTCGIAIVSRWMPVPVFLSRLITKDRNAENLLSHLMARRDNKSKYLGSKGCSLDFSFALQCAVALAVSGLCWPDLQAQAANFQKVQSGIVGSAWGDVNNDGWSDLVGPSTSGLWLNVADTNPGTPFVNQGEIFPSFSHVFNVVLGDYNNDGFLDAMGYRSGELGDSGPRLYTNNDGTSWTDHRDKFLPTTTSPAWVHRDIIWVDINGDGYLDNFITGWCEPWPVPGDNDMIYTSNAGETFSNTWSGPRYKGKGVTHVDFDRDGDQDIFVSNYWTARNNMWLNDGSGGLTDVANEYGLPGKAHTQGSAVGDFNNDGELDIYVSNFAHPGNQPPRFRENLGAAGDYHFKNRGPRGTEGVEPQDTAVLADYNNDGRLDLFITVSPGYGSPTARLFRNDGDWNFTNVTSSVGLNTASSSGGAESKAAWGDYNNDGFMDLVADGGVWKNPGAANWPDHHYLKIKLVGGQGANSLVNGSAIGSQVRIDVPGLGTVTRQVEGGTGQSVQNDLTLHFGLGTHDSPVDLEIFWADGTEQTVLGVGVDQFLTIAIPEPGAVMLVLCGLLFGIPSWRLGRRDTRRSV